MGWERAPSWRRRASPRPASGAGKSVFMREADVGGALVRAITREAIVPRRLLVLGGGPVGGDGAGTPPAEVFFRSTLESCDRPILTPSRASISAIRRGIVQLGLLATGT